MKTKKIDLKYAKLYLIKTNKFRSITIKVLLKDKLKKEDITKRNFLIDYLTLKDYALLYLILSLMSYLISQKFAKKLFKKSVVSTIKEEV